MTLSTWRRAAKAVQKRIALARKSSTPWKLELRETAKKIYKKAIKPIENVKESLSQLPKKELNEYLQAEPPAYSSSLTSMTGHLLRGASRTLRHSILNILCKERIEDLSISTKAAIIRSLQLDILRMDSLEMNAARAILLHTFGSELTTLKEMIDGGSTRVSPSKVSTELTRKFTFRRLRSGDLHHLVYRDFTDLELRYEILQHFAEESAKQMITYDKKPTKIISDIDDTLYGGWLDTRFPRHILYPGVLEFYQRLNLASQMPSISPSTQINSVTFLTARPRGWRGVIKNLTHNHLAALGIQESTVLSGSLARSLSTKEIAKKKFQNFQQYSFLYPEFSFIFNGDSGQADALLSQLILERYPHKVKAVFIHDVKPGLYTGDGGSKDEYRRLGMEFYATYAGAAKAAYKKGLIEDTSLVSIANACKNDLLAIDFGQHHDKKSLRLKELMEDLEVIDSMNINRER